MPICIECGESLPALYTEYSKGNIYISRCGRCGKVADKYIEFDNMIVLIDMILHKPQIYRHLLFNTDLFTPPETKKRERYVRWFKLCVLMVLFDVYIKWSQVERKNIVLASSGQFALTYMYLVLICSIEFTVFLVFVILGSRMLLKSHGSNKDILLALVLSSFGKLVHIFMLIWNFNELEYSWLVNASVLTSNAEALAALFKTTYWEAYLVLALSMGFKLAFQALLATYDPKFPVILF